MKSFKSEKAGESGLSMTFISPIIIENLVTILIGLVFSQIISTISSSALAAIGMSNTVMAVVTAAFSLVTTGSAVLVSRQYGAGDNAAAADTVEQTVLLTLISTAAITLICILSAEPVLRLLMPTAEDKLFSEALRYYKILMLSLPPCILFTVLSGVYRSLGNSRISMIGAVIMNAGQILFAWLFIVPCGLEEIGAGLAYLCCRILGAVFLFVALYRDHHYFSIRIKNMLRIRAATFKRIIHIGMPVSVESVFVQGGYMIANSMSISLGTFESGVYQIMNTLNGFAASLPQTICSTIALSVAGRLIGAKKYDDARRAGRIVWAIGIVAAVAFGAVLIFAGTPLSSLYSSDPAAISESAGLMWILLVMNLAGTSINSIDPQLRAGGDVKFVMIVTLIAVWGIKLPLTWLFCINGTLGVFGIFLANAISLYFRAILGFIRHCGKKWMIKKV